MKFLAQLLAQLLMQFLAQLLAKLFAKLAARSAKRYLLLDERCCKRGAIGASGLQGIQAGRQYRDVHGGCRGW